MLIRLIAYAKLKLMDDPTEKVEIRSSELVDAEVIKKVFSEYDLLIQKLPEEPRPISSKRYYEKTCTFVIDHRDDPNTKFKGEEINCTKLNVPIQKYVENWPPFHYHMHEINKLVGTLQKGEQWIMVVIKPGDLYRPKFGKHKSGFSDDTEEDLWWLNTDDLVVALSNTGKAIEARVWESQGKSKMKQGEWQHGRDRLKENISMEGLPLIDTAESFSEPINLLQGSTLERLKYIAHQAALGNVADWPEVFKFEEG